MHRLLRAFIALSVAAALWTVGANVSAQTQAAAGPSAQSAPPAKFVPPVKGQAEIGYLPPKTRVVGNEVVTTFQIKNMSLGAIAGLQVDEFWWDKDNNPVQGSGDRQRLKKPLMPGEVVTITLRSQKSPKMHRNNYQFSHANGTIKTKVLKTLGRTDSTTSPLLTFL